MQQSRLVKRFAGMTRFKHGRNVVVMFSPDKVGRDDYLWGLVFVGLLLMSVYFFWMIVLYIMRRRGEARHGWLSGAAFTIQAPSIELERKLGIRRMSEQEALAKAPIGYARIKEEEHRVRKKVSRLRWTFFACGAIYLLCSILFVTHGVTNLQNAINTLYGNAVDIETLTSEAVDNLHFGLRTIDNVAVRIRDMMLTQLDGPTLCPNDPNLQSTIVAQNVKQQINTAIPLMQDNIFIFPPPLLDTAQASIRSARRGAEMVVTNTENVNYTDWRAMLLLVPYVVVPAYVITVVIFMSMRADFNVYGCFVSCVLFPLMYLLTFAAWCCASMVIVALAVNADFCYPDGKGSSPDDSMYRIARAWGFTETDYQYQIMQYYVSQCTAVADPLLALRGYQPGLVREQ
jgi:hypothetical protein